MVAQLTNLCSLSGGIRYILCLQAGAVSVVPCEAVAGGRLVLAATGTLGPYDDVRYI